MTRILVGDVLEQLATLESESVNCVVTSPPYYGLRDYGVPGQIGLEPTLGEYLSKMVAVFEEVRRVLRKDGVCWLNMGDSYASAWTCSRRSTIGNGSLENGKREARPPRLPNNLKVKDLMGVPWRLAFALQDAGWWLRSDIVWHKPNPMPESIHDRPTRAHEYIFLLTKQARYWYDADAIRTEPLESSVLRLSQDVENQTGPLRANGGAKTNGTMKAVGLKVNQGRHAVISGGIEPSRCGTPETGANARTVWAIATVGFNGWAKTCRLEPVSACDASDGTLRITSPDCPIHAGLPDMVPKAFCGERAADELSRILGIDAHLVLAQLTSRVPIGLHRAVKNADGNLDLLLPLPCDSAICHNTRNHRTGPSLATNQPCKPCAQIDSRIQNIEALHDSSDLVDRTCESNTSEDLVSGVSSPSVQNQYRNVGICTCSYWNQFTQETSHFATFPPELPRRCILAGCPEGGTVLDPFLGSGTTLMVAQELGRNGIGIELNPEYAKMAEKRIADGQVSLFTEATQ